MMSQIWFQPVLTNTIGEFRMAQIVRVRVPNGGRGVEEAMRADCLSSRLRDDEKTVLKLGWTQGGASGRYRDAVVGEVPDANPWKHLKTRKPILNLTRLRMSSQCSCLCIQSMTDDRYGSWCTSLAVARRTDWSLSVKYFGHEASRPLQ